MMTGKAAREHVRGEDVMLGFYDIGLSKSTTPPTRLLSDVSGYVMRGGITAVLGASSSGKSILLKALAGRGNELASLLFSGRAVLDGSPIALLRSGYPVAFVRQDDAGLVGVLTVRETLTIAARLRCSPDVDIEQRVEDTMKRLGLEHVANGFIGTLLKRGLSGGQKRRVCVGVELVASPKVLLLDEPTSGLDTATAVSVIESIRKLAQESNGKLGVMLSIHQPNNDLLALFDHILLLSYGQPVFFGTLLQAERYFTSLGYSPAAGETPTNYYLQLTAGSGSGGETQHCAGVSDGATTNFVAEFLNSALNTNARHTVCSSASSTVIPEKSSVLKSTFFTQFFTLLSRNFIVARRDLALLYLQFVLHAMYGFLIGASFYKLTPTLDDRVNEVFASIVWIMGLNAYIQVFKVHYLNSSWSLFHQEKPNNAYGVLAYFSSELLTTLIYITIFIAGTAIAFFMIRFDSSRFGFSGALVAYTTVFTTEGTAHFLTQVTAPNAALGVLMTQAVLVVGFVFAGGIFIRESNIPNYWKWFSELSLFKHGSYAMMDDLIPNMDFRCPANRYDNVAGTCTPDAGGTFLCNRIDVDGTCLVKGRDVMDSYFGMDRNKWFSLLYLFILGLVCRLLVLVLYRYPMSRILRAITSKFSPRMRKHLMELDDRNRRLEEKVNLLEKQVLRGDRVYKAAVTIQRAWRAYLLRKAMSKITRSHRSLGANWVASHDKSLVFRNVTVSLPKSGKILVDNVSGIAGAGRICALMGPSGAGKTTLLNGLSGRAPYAKVTGYVTVGKKLLTKDDLAYVPQFDTINPSFTPRELVLLASRLLSRDPTIVQKRRVDDLLKIMGLGDVIDTRCGELTGGQLKRVSIALGLVGQPAVLFLDEPTTGLDSTAAFQIVSYIAKVAEARNTVVIMTIHQPSMSVFARMHDLLLLSTGGKLAYYGTVERSSAYFASCGMVVPASVNPADFALVAVSEVPPKELGKDWSEVYNRSRMKEEVPIVVVDPKVTSENKKPSEIARFFVLVSHLLVYYYRQAAMYFYRMVGMIFIGFFIGTLYYNLDLELLQLTEIAGAIFFSVWVVLFLVVGNTGVLVFDRLVVQDSYASNRHGLVSWSLAQFVASVPYTLVSSLLFVLFFHWLIDVTRLFENFVYTVLLFWALQELMGAIVWCVVETLKDSMLSTTFSMIVLGSLFLFAGFFIQHSVMPVGIQWLPWIMPSRYAFRGLIINYLDDISLSSAFGNVDGSLVADRFFGIGSSENKWAMWAIVLAFMVGIRAVHIMLMWMHHHKLGQSLSTGPAPENVARPADVVVVDMNTSRESMGMQHEENFVDGAKEKPIIVTSI